MKNKILYIIIPVYIIIITLTSLSRSVNRGNEVEIIIDSVFLVLEVCYLIWSYKTYFKNIKKK